MARRSFAQMIKDWVTRTTSKAAEFAAKTRGASFDRVQWLSLLDSKTCPTCGSRHGSLYSINERHPSPPAHPRCRCVLYFLKRKELPIADDSFDEWLRDQDEYVIEEVLGIAKAKLFLEGGLEIKEFVDDTGKELTLLELREANQSLYDRILSP